MSFSPVNIQSKQFRGLNQGFSTFSDCLKFLSTKLMTENCDQKKRWLASRSSCFSVKDVGHFLAIILFYCCILYLFSFSLSLFAWFYWLVEVKRLNFFLSLLTYTRRNTFAWRTSPVQRSLFEASWTTMWCRRSLWCYTCRYGPHFLTTTCRKLLLCCLWPVKRAQDTFNGSASDQPFFTSVASITVLVKDVDNRPPWFQPCLRTNLGTAKLCVSAGYRGRVNLTEKEVSGSNRRLPKTEDTATLLLPGGQSWWCVPFNAKSDVGDGNYITSESTLIQLRVGKKLEKQPLLLLANNANNSRWYQTLDSLSVRATKQLVHNKTLSVWRTQRLTNNVQPWHTRWHTVHLYVTGLGCTCWNMRAKISTSLLLTLHNLTFSHNHSITYSNYQ